MSPEEIKAYVLKQEGTTEADANESVLSDGFVLFLLNAHRQKVPSILI